MKYSLVLIALILSPLANAKSLDIDFWHKKAELSSVTASAAMKNVMNRINDEVLKIVVDSAYNHFTTLVVRTRDGRVCQAAVMGSGGGNVLCLINSERDVRFEVDSSGNIID